MVLQILGAVVTKSLMWLKSSLFFWLCTDTYYSMKPHGLMRDKPTTVKTLILIRHGESQWNYGFNNPGGFSVFRIFKMTFWELLVYGKHDSTFLDSPLSPAGVRQAMGLRTYLNETPDNNNAYVSLLKNGNAKIVSSNLRRAIATTVIALYDRWEKSSEKLHTLSVLQEITRNVDSFCITPAGTTPKPSALDLTLKEKVGVDMSEFLARRVQPLEHKGTKGIFSNGEIRINKFIKWIFESNEECFIIGGHSLYFKEIFKGYLPKESTYVGKKYKMINGAAVGFKIGEFVGVDGKVVYQILENSVQIIHLGFVKKKVLKKVVAMDTILFTVVVAAVIWKGFFS